MVWPTDTVKTISHGSSLLRQAPINVRRLWAASIIIIIIIIMPLIHLTALGANKNPPCYSIYCSLLFSQSSIVSSKTVLYHILLDLSRVPVLRLMSYINRHFNRELASIYAILEFIHVLGDRSTKVTHIYYAQTVSLGNKIELS